MKCSPEVYTRINHGRTVLCRTVQQAPGAEPTWEQLFDSVQQVPLACAAIEGWLRSFQPGLQKLDPTDSSEINPFHSLLRLSLNSPRRALVLRRCCQELDKMEIDTGYSPDSDEDDLLDDNLFELNLDEEDEGITLTADDEEDC